MTKAIRVVERARRGAGTPRSGMAFFRAFLRQIFRCYVPEPCKWCKKAQKLAVLRAEGPTTARLHTYSIQFNSPVLQIGARFELRGNNKNRREAEKQAARRTAAEKQAVRRRAAAAAKAAVATVVALQEQCRVMEWNDVLYWCDSAASKAAQERYWAELESDDEEEGDYQHGQGEDCEQQILFGTVDKSEWYDDDDDDDWDGDDDFDSAPADCVQHA